MAAVSDGKNIRKNIVAEKNKGRGNRPETTQRYVSDRNSTALNRLKAVWEEGKNCNIKEAFYDVDLRTPFNEMLDRLANLDLIGELKNNKSAGGVTVYELGAEAGLILDAGISIGLATDTHGNTGWILTEKVGGGVGSSWGISKTYYPGLDTIYELKEVEISSSVNLGPVSMQILEEKGVGYSYSYSGSFFDSLGGVKGGTINNSWYSF